MPKRKPPFDWDALNRQKKAGKAEAVEHERATKEAQARREFYLRTIAQQDALDEQARLQRIAEADQPRQLSFTIDGENKPRKVAPKGCHDFRLAPYESYSHHYKNSNPKMICSKCGMSKEGAIRDNLPCAGH